MNHDDVLVLGIGNLLWADEGFGVRCVEAFDARYLVPPGVRLVDGGTQGMYLVNAITDARRLLIFDAIDWGDPPGAMRVLRGEEVPRYTGVRKTSLHQTSFAEVLAAADLMGRLPEAVTLVGAQAGVLDDYGGGLTPEVAACIDPALALAAQELTAWGFAPERRKVAAMGERVVNPALARERYEGERPGPEIAFRHGDPRFL
ncbi:MAG: HyaD/HybD family hydrogenase maturation endopeptidase [Myxococcales bacterium]|nr:HyaD/HybD family hydrogenase maturation endopeptidase [Myxococcales bacterium]